MARTPKRKQKFRIPMKEDPFTTAIIVRTAPCDVCGKPILIDKPGWAIVASGQVTHYGRGTGCLDILKQKLDTDG